MKTIYTTSPATAKACALGLGAEIEVPGQDEDGNDVAFKGVVMNVSFEGEGKYKIVLETGD